MVVYVALAYVIVRWSPLGPCVARRSHSSGSWCSSSVSRLYLGVHYPSDIIAEFAVGFAWAVFSALAVEVVRHARARPEPDASPAFPPEDVSYRQVRGSEAE